jgi:hypothetical protein
MTASPMETRSTPLSIRLGFWSALGIAVLFILFTLCFVAIALSPPLYTWTNLANYLTYVQSHNQFFPNLARLTMLLFGPLFVILLNSIHDYASDETRLLARISLCFGVIFAALTGIHYFVQLSAVRLSIASGATQGLEQLVQANPNSAISAINLLGWSLFLGLSSLFIAPVFRGSRLEKVIRFSFLLNGIFCLLGGVGYILNIVIVIFLTLNFGMGGAVLLAAITLTLLFRRMERQKL